MQKILPCVNFYLHNTLLRRWVHKFMGYTLRPDINPTEWSYDYLKSAPLWSYELFVVVTIHHFHQPLTRIEVTPASEHFSVTHYVCVLSKASPWGPCIYEALWGNANRFITYFTYMVAVCVYLYYSCCEDTRGFTQSCCGNPTSLWGQRQFP